MSTLPKNLDGLQAARKLYGPQHEQDRAPESASATPDDDTLFEAWARGYRQGLQDGKERAPVLDLYPLVAPALDTDSGGPHS